MSLPAWGAWIEIICLSRSAKRDSSLPAWGAWIEIVPKCLAYQNGFRRSPHGERGLKFTFSQIIILGRHVAPRMGSVD